MLVKDFHELRATVEKMGLFKSRFSFFAWMFMHAFILDIASWCIIWYFGKSWMPFLLGVVMFTIGQGGPMSIWNYMHNQHHAKPNCFRKDPDINTHPMFFSLGKKLSLKSHTHFVLSFCIFILVFAPLMFAIGAQLVSFRFLLLRRKWLELFTLVFYNVRVCLMFVPLMGFKSFMAYYWLARCLEASWFIWVSQMSHIPMNIDYDQNLDWVSAQLSATCNVGESLFNDWFTGHLNFQIEHHLFPTMPRHNYYKVVPLVKSLCAKHNIKYECKPLLSAFADVVRSLKESGKAWYNAYYQE
ncbi:putative Fatty acid desaturase 1-like protein [Naja naja]|nr:putative Fatty acid desaturase 1-like protein [Naja naja]